MTRVEREKETVRQMIELYCTKCEGNNHLCLQCGELLDYALTRLEKCKFGNHKSSCKKCPVHCYKPEMRQKIRCIMRWSGPRMILYHPIKAVRHVIDK